MRYARVAGAVVAVLSAFAVGGIATAERARSCDGCLVGVAADGSLLGSRGVVSSRRLGAGLYEVRFRRSIGGCAIAANQVKFSDSRGPTFGYVIVEVQVDDPKVLRYSVVLPSGGGFQTADAAFTSLLTCL